MRTKMFGTKNSSLTIDNVYGNYERIYIHYKDNKKQKQCNLDSSYLLVNEKHDLFNVGLQRTAKTSNSYKLQRKGQCIWTTPIRYFQYVYTRIFYPQVTSNQLPVKDLSIAYCLGGPGEQCRSNSDTHETGVEPAAHVTAPES